MRKVAIIGALTLVLVGLGSVSYTLCSSGALEGFNRNYNIFNMVDESLRGMQEMGEVMNRVRENVVALNQKLDLVARTNELLHRQMAVVDEINAAMAGQKPLLEETNESLGRLEGKLRLTLRLARGLVPISGALLLSMQDSLNLTEGVAEGSSGMVGMASTIAALFDQTLGYLARIQPKSAKAKAYMRGDILSRLSQFTPRQTTAAVPSTTAGGSGVATHPIFPQQLLSPSVLQVIEGVSGNPISGLLEGMMKLLGGQ